LDDILVFDTGKCSGDKSKNGMGRGNATSIDEILTKNLEQNVREIEEERKLLRALVENSNSTSGQEKPKNRKKPDVAKQLILPVSNNINQASTGNSSTRVSYFTKPST
jgi:hypothetical protein